MPQCHGPQPFICGSIIDDETNINKSAYWKWWSCNSKPAIIAVIGPRVHMSASVREEGTHLVSSSDRLLSLDSLQSAQRRMGEINRQSGNNRVINRQAIRYLFKKRSSFSRRLLSNIFQFDWLNVVWGQMIEKQRYSVIHTYIYLPCTKDVCRVGTFPVVAVFNIIRYFFFFLDPNLRYML